MSDILEMDCPVTQTNDVGGVAADRLKAIIQKIERWEEEKKGISDDIKDELTTAKSEGYNVKAIRRVLRLRKLDKETRDAEDNDVALYLMALGDI